MTNKKPALFFFLVAVLLAFLAAFMAVNAVQSFNEKVTVFVAAKNIPPYTKISPDMVKQVPVATAAIIGTKITDINELLGKYTNATVHQEEPITKETLSDSPGGEMTAELNAKKRLDIRALPISVDSISGFGGKLDKGDRIDFIATVNAVTNQGNELVTSYIAQNIPVISRVEDGDKLIGVVVEATAKQAQEISHYMETGKLKIVVQPQPASQELKLAPTTTKGFHDLNRQAATN